MYSNTYNEQFNIMSSNVFQTTRHYLVTQNVTAGLRLAQAGFPVTIYLVSHMRVGGSLQTVTMEGH